MKKHTIEDLHDFMCDVIGRCVGFDHTVRDTYLFIGADEHEKLVRVGDLVRFNLQNQTKIAAAFAPKRKLRT